MKYIKKFEGIRNWLRKKKVEDITFDIDNEDEDNEHKSEPKYKVGDICYFVTPGFENDPEDWQETMIIDGDAIWNNYSKGYWEYPIKGKANYCPEGLLKLRKIKVNNEDTKF